jgi:hypothetical protein
MRRNRRNNKNTYADRTRNLLTDFVIIDEIKISKPYLQVRRESKILELVSNGRRNKLI